MKKVLLLVGVAIGDSPYYYLVEKTAAEAIIGDDTDPRWFDICDAMSKYLEAVGDDIHADVFKDFSTAREALAYAAENNLEVEEEVDFTVY